MSQAARLPGVLKSQNLWSVSGCGGHRGAHLVSHAHHCPPRRSSTDYFISGSVHQGPSDRKHHKPVPSVSVAFFSLFIYTTLWIMTDFSVGCFGAAEVQNTEVQTNSAQPEMSMKPPNQHPLCVRNSLLGPPMLGCIVGRGRLIPLWPRLSARLLLKGPAPQWGFFGNLKVSQSRRPAGVVCRIWSLVTELHKEIHPHIVIFTSHRYLPLAAASIKNEHA